MACAGAFIAWKKLRPEKRYIEADTASKFQDAADKAADRLEKVQGKCDELEVKIGDLEKQLDKANEKISLLETALQKTQDAALKYEHWAKMLRQQIIDQFSGTPVTLEWSERKRLEKSAGQ